MRHLRWGLPVLLLLVVAGAGLPQGGGDYLPAGSDAPDFQVTATDGADYHLEALLEKGPVFLTFWKDPCPHNPRAMPFFNAFKKAYGEKVVMLSAVRSSDSGTKRWGQQFDAAFPLLPDPNSVMIDAYETLHSIATFQIGTDGKIARVFEGYGRAELTALNEALAAAAGTTLAEVDLSRAPSRQTWG